MPEYAFKCPDCGTAFFKSLALANRNADVPCPDCETIAKKQVAGTSGLVLRGDVWPGKNIRVKNQMKARRDRVGRREHELKMDGPQFELAPNVEGQRVDSWDEAAKLARSKGKDTTIYDQRARKAAKRGSRT